MCECAGVVWDEALDLNATLSAAVQPLWRWCRLRSTPYSKTLATLGAVVWCLTCVSVLVSFEIYPYSKTLATLGAVVWCLTCVSVLVSFEMSPYSETLATLAAGVWPRSCVGRMMQPEPRPRVEGFTRQRTGVLFGFICLGGCRGRLGSLRMREMMKPFPVSQ